ncbi:hypothetical protein [Azospirillum humicireducens]|uniref:hypothetical protein n=1 Tax=Azospirillum humicireducens TaxID=1226968 RepID=UPI0011B29EF0|nr:hypothetical protein [Azospirillum humicireducens]
MTPEEEFAKNPLKFMKNNIVIAPSNIPNVDFNLFLFNFQLSRSYFGKFPMGIKKINVYNLIPDRSKGKILAYWCPYKQSGTCEIVVGNLADFMFTVKMDGCSFGIAPPAGDGTRRVAHINMFGQQNPRIKQKRVLEGMGLDDGIVDANVYMNLPGKAAANATTFGIRDPNTNAWEFYYQMSKFITGNQLRLMGVSKVT